MKTIGLATLVLLGGTMAAMAQDDGLPAACLGPNAEHAMGPTAEEMTMDPMDEAHHAMMAGMDRMHADMDAAMKAEDIDVTFICGMIPHHQGAIDMARAELKYGDDQWAREMAQKVIAAQEAEIAQMQAWLAKAVP